MAKKAKKVKKGKRATRKKTAKKKPTRRRSVKKRTAFIKKAEAHIFEGVHKTKIKVIGIGGGGGSIVSEIAGRIKKADFVAANTDARALRGISKKVKKFQFGQQLTNGLGTGMNAETGELAAQEEKEKIKKLFDGQDLCIIISSLGGGTGAGAAPVFAKIAKSNKCLTYGIFTLPFEFEGEKKMEIAKQALLKLKPYFNIFSIIPNERIFQIIDKNTPLQEALSAINKRLVGNLEGLMEMIYSTGLINIDFADLKAVLAGYGKLAYLNTIEIAEAAKEEAARRVASTPLYPYSVKGSRGVLYNIVGGGSLCLSDVSKISEIISESINKSAKIIFGINQDRKYKDKIKITLLSTGCSYNGELLRKKKAPSKPKEKKEPKPAPKPEPDQDSAPKTKKKPKTKPEPKIKSSQSSASEPQKKKKTKKPKPKTKPAPEQKSESEEKIRRNALEVKKVAEEEEEEFLEKESVWETPAILRKKEND